MSCDAAVTRRLRATGIRDKPIVPRSPWQNGVAERLIGSTRRECSDHVVALGEGHSRRTLQSYARYYNELRTHRSLNKDAPFHRPIEGRGCHHFTAGPRCTLPPILPNPIFGTRISHKRVASHKRRWSQLPQADVLSLHLSVYHHAGPCDGRRWALNEESAVARFGPTPTALAQCVGCLLPGLACAGGRAHQAHDDRNPGKRRDSRRAGDWP
jgi:hypothetical protein